MDGDASKYVERSSPFEAAKAGLGKEDIALLFGMSEAAAWKLILTVRHMSRKKKP